MQLIKLVQNYWKGADKADKARIASQTPTPGVHEICDIPYIDDGNLYHYLDVYYPEGTAKPLPVIIDIHGGGWVYGTKEINKNYNLYLASLGYTVFSINYRLVPDCTIGGQIEDCMAALKFIAENIENYPCDKTKVYLTGDSAGGYLAAHTAVVNTSAELREVYNAEPSGLEIRAVGLTSAIPYLDLGGIGDYFYDRIIRGKNYKKEPYYGLVNLDSVIDKGKMPPTFLTTSLGDTPARKATLKAYNLLESKNIKTELLDWQDKNLGHVFSVGYPEMPESKKTIDSMLAFFKNA